MYWTTYIPIAIAVLALIWELIAIIVDKESTPTFSEWFWMLMGSSKIRRGVVLAFFIWLALHLAFGPCAFGLCFDWQIY